MSLNAKNILVLGFIVTLLIAIPVTVYILQKTQQTETSATAATTLCYTKTSDTTCLDNTNKLNQKVDDTFTIDVFMKPNSNNVIATTLNISYDPTKISTSGAALVRSSDAFPSLIEGPVYGDGTISITMSVGIDLTKVIKTDTKIATITFKALAPTDANGTQVTFTNLTTVTSTVADPETNVLSTSTPATIVIGGNAAVTPTSTITPTDIIVRESPTPNNSPVCESLNMDRSATGSAPLAITFTAVGRDTDGKIQKATFNFGDGPVEDVTVGGGIGTSSVSIQKAHQYNNAGNFTASVILTDDRGGISQIAGCTKAISVEPGPTVPIGEPIQPTTIPTNTPSPIPTSALLSPIPSPGADGKVLGVGIAGAVLTIIGGIVFFAL